MQKQIFQWNRMTLCQEATLLYTGEKCRGEVTLAPYGTAVFAVG